MPGQKNYFSKHVFHFVNPSSTELKRCNSHNILLMFGFMKNLYPIMMPAPVWLTICYLYMWIPLRWIPNKIVVVSQMAGDVLLIFNNDFIFSRFKNIQKRPVTCTMIGPSVKICGIISFRCFNRISVSYQFLSVTWINSPCCARLKEQHPSVSTTSFSLQH